MVVFLPKPSYALNNIAWLSYIFMNTKIRLKTMLAALLLQVSLALSQPIDHKGREFFVAFLPNPVEPLTLQLHLQSDVDTAVLVEYPVGTPLQDSVRIRAGEARVVALPAAAGRINRWPNRLSLQGDRNAIRVSASAEISCTLISRNDASSDAGLALPVETLQSNYVIMSYDISEASDGDAGVFAVVAPYDSTIVTITPTQPLTGGVAAQQSLKIMLQRGEAFLAESLFDYFGRDVSLAGSFVKSNKPVSVINGNKCARVPFGLPSCDHLFEFATPIQTWGKQILVHALGQEVIRPSGANYRVLVSAPNTTVYLDGTAIGTIDENQYLDVDTLSGSHVFSADQPILVTQFMTSKIAASSQSADPAMVNMVPTEQFVRNSTFSIPVDAQNLPFFENNRMTAIVKNEDIGQFELDGTVVPVQEFTAIQNSGYSVATIEFDQQITHRTSSPNGHSALVWGFSNDNSYIFPAGMLLEPINPLDDAPPEITVSFSETLQSTAFGSVFDSKTGRVADRDTLLYGGEQSGIANIDLTNSENVQLFDLNFERGDEFGTFALSLIDRNAPGRATIRAIDLTGNQSTYAVSLPIVDVHIIEPVDQFVTIDERVALTARARFQSLGSDDLSQYQKLDTVFVNNQAFSGTALNSDDTTISVTLPLQVGENRLIAKRMLRRIEQGSVSGPLAFASDTITVVRAALLTCDGLRFISPTDSQVVRSEQIDVALESTVQGGLLPISREIVLQNITTGQNRSRQEMLQSTPLTDTAHVSIPLTLGWNRLTATLTLQDVFGQTSVCNDTIDVFRPDELICQLEIENPQDGTFQTAGLFPFRARIEASGGVVPYADTTGYFIVNDDTLAAQFFADSSMTAEVPLQLGQNTVQALMIVTDAAGQQSQCSQTISVTGVEALQCNVSVSNYSDGDSFSTDSLRVKVEAYPVGGVLPIAQQLVRIIINQDTTHFREVGSRNFTASGPALEGANSIEVIAHFIDAIGQQTDCGQQLVVTKVDPLLCRVQIISPQDGIIVTNDSIEVVAVAQAISGVPPFTVSRSLNGVPITAQTDTFSVRIPLVLGENGVVVSAIFQDQAGQKSTCGDGITVTREKGPLCDLTIVEPKDGAYVLGDSVLVKAYRQINGGIPPFEETHTINGISVEVERDTLQLKLPLFEGENSITVTSVIVDSVRQRTMCEQTISIIKPDKPNCEIALIEPADSSLIASDSVQVVAVVNIAGGVSPYQIFAEVNGRTAVLQNDTLSAWVPLQVGENPIIITTNVQDAVGQSTQCEKQLFVSRPSVPVCSLAILQPSDSLLTTAGSVLARARATVSGGVQPYADTLFAFIINADTIQIAPAGDSLYAAELPLSSGENTVTALFNVTDSLGQVAACSQSISVFQAEPMACELQILSPVDGAVVIRDSVSVQALARVTGGIAPRFLSGIINEAPASWQNDTLTATIALELGKNPVSAKVIFVDVNGDTTSCSQSIEVLRETFAVRVRILSPQDSSYSCDDSLFVTAGFEISGGEGPFDMMCEINGREITASNGMFAANVARTQDATQIIALCTVTDAIGRLVSGADSVTVLVDNILPVCDFKPENGKIVGMFADFETGIASIKPEYINNGRLKVERFQKGAKIVKFEIEPIDPEQVIGFNINVTDVCGNNFLCDPFYLNLDTNDPRQINLTFPSVDRYFYIDNYGIEEIQFELNGKLFTFSTTAATSENHYLIPAFGKISFDLGPCLQDDGNQLTVTFSGPPGTGADLLLMDVDTGVEYVLEYNEVLPTAFQLLQNYPNPFNPETIIPIQIPANWPHRVKIHIFNATGRLIKILHDDYLPAGHNTFLWDGTDQHGKTVASGVYLYRAISGQTVLLKKLVLAR